MVSPISLMTPPPPPNLSMATLRDLERMLSRPAARQQAQPPQPLATQDQQPHVDLRA